MGKRTYRAADIKDLKVESLAPTLAGRVVLGVDVAKKKQLVSITTEDRTSVAIFKWSHPEETPLFTALCEDLRERGLTVEVAMEPSGTYGDAMRCKLLSLKFDVYQVAGKRVHDAAEVFDGVPSTHDAKAAVLIARLHLDKASKRWPMASATERELEARRQEMAVHSSREQSLLGKLEALIARHWPELTEHLGLTAVTLLELLAHYGGPAQVAADLDAARALMAKIGKRFLAPETIDAVLKSAGSTAGVPMLAAEESLVRVIADEALDAHRKAAIARKGLVKATANEVAPEMSALLGAVTAATIVACGVDPRKYKSARALEKAFGLNLREHSSGTKKGGLHITKRGDSMARQVLYMATLRLILNDPIAAAWYRKKVARDGGESTPERRGNSKIKAVVALMRKLVKGLWHVGRGAAFDATKLFNVQRLGLPAPSPAATDQKQTTAQPAAIVQKGGDRMS